MKYYKMLSGVGRVEMTADEVKELFDNIETEPVELSQIEKLEKKINEISAVIGVLRKSELLSGLFALAERKGELSGDS